MSTGTVNSDRFDPLTGNVRSVFVRYSYPEVLAFVVTSSAGFVDAIFLGNFVGPAALAAVNLSMPIWALIMGLGMLASVGGSVVAGKRIGEGDRSSANPIFTVTFLITVGMSIVISALALIFIDQLVAALGATDAELAGLLTTYLWILLWLTPPWMLQLVLFYFVRLDGKPRLASGAFIIGGLINIAFDYVFVVRMGMGIAGAAYATGLSVIFPCFILLGHFLLGRSGIHFTRHLSDWLEVCKSFANGFSEFVNEISVGITTFIFNWVMVTNLGMEGVAALTIINYLLLLGLMFTYGISDSMQPIISQNFGAGNHHRIVEFMRLSAIVVGSIGVILALLALIFPDLMINVFLTDESVGTSEIAARFLSVLWPVFIFNAFSILISGYLTSMHKPAQSALIAGARSFALPAFFLLLLPIWLGTQGIFLALPLAEALTLALAVAIFWRETPKKLVEQDQAKKRESP